MARLELRDAEQGEGGGRGGDEKRATTPCIPAAAAAAAAAALSRRAAGPDSETPSVAIERFTTADVADGRSFQTDLDELCCRQDGKKEQGEV